MGSTAGNHLGCVAAGGGWRGVGGLSAVTAGPAVEHLQGIGVYRLPGYVVVLPGDDDRIPLFNGPTGLAP